MRIPVPHFQQETDCTCLPACVRTVLTFLGDARPESELALAFQAVRNWGTLPEQVEAPLTTWGYRVRWFEGTTLERLEQLQAHQFPVMLSCAPPTCRMARVGCTQLSLSILMNNRSPV